MAPKEPKNPKDPRDDGAAGPEGEPTGSPSDQPVGSEGAEASASTGAEDENSGFSPEDLSFLSDVSDGKVEAPTDAESEHLLDLKRVTAEYANYRRRTEANRQVERDRAVGDTLAPLLPVLDDLDRADKHGDLAEGGPLTAIAQKLRAAVERLGLVAYGAAGEAFDPAHHEAIFQKPNPEVSGPTIADVVERGYRIGDVTLRAAKVVVDTPE